MQEIKVFLLFLTIGLFSCSGGGGGSSTQGGFYSSPYITAQQFTNALNQVDGVGSSDTLVLDVDSTARSQIAGEDQYFVIYDSNLSGYRAVSLQYIRALKYFDVANNDNYLTADAYRESEYYDYNVYGNFNGDGNNYEGVTYNSSNGYFYGDVSGYAYEEGIDTHDVNLVAAEKEDLGKIKLATKISYTYSIDIKSSLSLVSFADVVSPMVKSGQASGHLTIEDQEILMHGLEKMTGVTLEEVQQSLLSGERDKIISKISTKIGTTSSSLENKILPELFGVNF